MTDTHTHLYLEEFDADGQEAAVQRALSAGVSRMIFPNVDASTVGRAMSLQAQFSDCTRFAMGLHPTEVDADWQPTVEAMRTHFSNAGCVAVGEVGIDLYWDKSKRELQMDAFRYQLRLARELDLPVIIHCREALDEVLECIAAEDASRQPMVFHSFTGTADDARRIIEAVPGAMFGINGVVTFKNASSLREALPVIGIGRIVLETDSPYLAPVPHRGRRNESAYLPEVCRMVASVLDLPAANVEHITDANASALFNL